MVDRVDPALEIKDDFRYKSDTKCCCVVTLMKVMNCTYDKAYKWCRDKGGRLNGQGMVIGQVDRMFEAMINTRQVKGPYTNNNRITITQFIKKHPKGRFFCVHRGHAFAIIDGVLYDHTDKPRRQILYARRVYLPSLETISK